MDDQQTEFQRMLFQRNLQSTTIDALETFENADAAGIVIREVGAFVGDIAWRIVDSSFVEGSNDNQFNSREEMYNHLLTIVVTRAQEVIAQLASDTDIERISFDAE